MGKNMLALLCVGIIIILNSCGKPRVIDYVMEDHKNTDFTSLKNTYIHRSFSFPNSETYYIVVDTLDFNRCIVSANRKNHNINKITYYVDKLNPKKKYITKNQIKSAIQKFNTLGVYAVYVDSSMNVFFEPFYSDGLFLLRKNVNFNILNLKTKYTLVRDNWYIESRYSIKDYYLGIYDKH